MRQLTSLDAEFLALETPSVYGHVSGLSIYDSSTAPGGTLTAADLCRTIGERLHLLRPFTWKLAEVPFGLGTVGPLRPPLNLVISNVPGPREPLCCAGARLLNHFPVSVITEGMGLNLTAMSYLDHIDVGIVVDREQVDPWPFMTALDGALGELDQAVCGTGTSTGRRTAAAPRDPVVVR